ncbi:Apoptosis-inducing factor 2 [Mycena sanguinolenta]|uniref:Apoptosis-inducing factor 2 n=1 Tax=Mycena sanguinolenta TaxID=230812 RepID=A0A8H6ZEX5_9AGAR|nr:Apoptosis-inducing factor 2 [Mycena sanguinolenta]
MEHLKLIRGALRILPLFLSRALHRQFSAFLQRWTYKALPDAKNVVVLGGSFAGLPLVDGLAATLPTGYKVVFIEKNSHINFLFAFPRFSVVPGYEHTAFIPYDGIAKGAPAGLVTRIQDTAVGLTETHVRLASGREIEYEYLAIATGSSQPLPVQVSSTELVPGCRELQSVQQSIKASQKIAVVGAGAVGVQLSTDIKSFNPEKDVTLIHSRSQILNSFGKRLHDHVLPILQNEYKIRVLLNERPQLPKDRGLLRDQKITFADGHEEAFDLVMACTGQRPNSAFLAPLAPDAISKETSRILVKPTLQVVNAPSPRIFAFGDVADTGGPKMGRAGLFQGYVVLDNILAMIHGRAPSATYAPRYNVEGSITLTLGKARGVMYSQDDPDATSDVLIPTRGKGVDLGIAHAWGFMFNADFKQAKEGAKLLAESESEAAGNS